MAVSPVAQPNHQRNPLVPVSPVVEQAVDNWAALAMPANLEVDNWAAERAAEPALAKKQTRFRLNELPPGAACWRFCWL